MAGPFQNNFSTENPEGSDLANQLDSFIREGTKSAIDERIELEHYSLEDGVNDTSDPEGQGRHKAGLVGCLGYGDLEDRTNLGVPGRGALFQCTEEDPAGPYPAGTIYRYETPGVGWTPSQVQLQGTIYATDEEAVAGIAEDKAINPKHLVQSILAHENVYVPLTRATHALEPPYGNFIYNIADFEGVDLNTDNIRALYIYANAQNGNNTMARVQASYPDGVVYDLVRAAAYGDEDNIDVSGVTRIPIARGQTTIQVNRIQGAGSCYCKLFAVDQIEFWEV